MKKKNASSFDYKSRIIENQKKQIRQLKEIVDKLEIDNKDKQELMFIFNSAYGELKEEISKVRDSQKKCDALIVELKKMRTVMNRTVFKGRWKLIQLLMK